MPKCTIILALIFVATASSVRAVEVTFDASYAQYGTTLNFYGSNLTIGTYAVPEFPSPVTSVELTLIGKSTATQALMASQSYDVHMAYLGSGGQSVFFNGASFTRFSVTPYAHVPNSPTSGKLRFRFEIPIPPSPPCICGSCCSCTCICGNNQEPCGKTGLDCDCHKCTKCVNGMSCSHCCTCGFNTEPCGGAPSDCLCHENNDDDDDDDTDPNCTCGACCSCRCICGIPYVPLCMGTCFHDCSTLGIPAYPCFHVTMPKSFTHCECHHEEHNGEDCCEHHAQIAENTRKAAEQAELANAKLQTIADALTYSGPGYQSPAGYREHEVQDPGQIYNRNPVISAPELPFTPPTYDLNSQPPFDLTKQIPKTATPETPERPSIETEIKKYFAEHPTGMEEAPEVELRAWRFFTRSESGFPVLNSEAIFGGIREKLRSKLPLEFLDDFENPNGSGSRDLTWTVNASFFGQNFGTWRIDVGDYLDAYASSTAKDLIWYLMLFAAGLFFVMGVLKLFTMLK